MNTFESKRLYFVPLNISHLPLFAEMDQDPEVMKYYGRGISNTLDETQLRLEEYLTYAQTHSGLGAFMAFKKDSHEFIGLAVIIHLDKNPKAHEFEIGYRLPQKNWGRGYATEMAKAIIKYGQRRLSLKEFYGTTDPLNEVSQKVLTKVGFKYIGDGPYHGGSKVYKLKTPFYFNEKNITYLTFIIECLIGTTIGFYIYKHYPKGGAWCLFSILLVIAPDRKDAMKLALTRIKANFVGAIIGLILFYFLPITLFKICLGITAAILICEWFKLQEAMRSAIIAVLIITLHEPGQHFWDIALERALGVIIGCLIGVLLTYIFHIIVQNVMKVFRKIRP